MLRDYQIELADQASVVLRDYRIVYLSMEMRVGKTLIALKTAEILNLKNVLFITKKKAISSIESDYQNEGFTFKLTVINYEQCGKYEPDYDLIVVDEAHSLGAFPKPTNRTKQIQRLVKNNYLILCSGTPSPESYSQLFHQFAVSIYSPFDTTNFYAWAKQFVSVRQKIINGYKINDYSRADKDKIWSFVGRYFISYTRSEAGFTQSNVVEQIKTVEISANIKWLINHILKERFYKFQDGQTIVCDSAVKLQSKVHQLFSGTVKTEDGDIKILDYSKVEFIKKNYFGKKIAIFYKFIAEGLALKSQLSNWTDDPFEFNESCDKIFISQIQSGAMGINHASADVLVFYNIDFSSNNYWQARARLQALERVSIPEVHWLFADGGIESKVYQVVQKKKDYTNYYFKQHYLKENA